MFYVKEIFKSLQGEGYFSGRKAIFVRFSGCNLWNGQADQRSNSVCSFCDTDFVGTDGPGGGKFSNARELANHIYLKWPSDSKVKPFLVCTGGEPLLQMDDALVKALHKKGFEIAVETNGTINPPKGIDWICVSPKGKSKLKIKKGNELKLVYPQNSINPSEFENFDFDFFSLQPLDGKKLKENTQKTIEYCSKHPLWRLSLQTHKFLGIP